MIDIDGKYENNAQLDQLAQAEKLQLLYSQSFPAIFASLLGGLLVCTVLWPVQNHPLLISWFLVLSASSLIRLILFVRYWQLKPRGGAILSWEQPYFLTLLLSALIWGLGIIVILPPQSVLHQIVVYYFVIGMAGGAFAVYSAHRPMTLTTIACIIFPITLWFLLQGTLLSTAMVIGAVAFFISLVRAGKILSATMHQSFRLAHQLRHMNEVAESMARRDELTGLVNRRGFYEQGELYANHCQRNDEVLAMILMDVDFFKKINDTLGHAAGDATLKQLGKIFQKTVRGADICARIGGEEFAILSLVTTPLEAEELAERLRQLVAEADILFDKARVSITASFGVSSGDYNLDRLFQKADSALYRAKEEGRNCVVTA